MLGSPHIASNFHQPFSQAELGRSRDFGSALRLLLQAFPEQAFLSPPSSSRDIGRASHMSVVTLQLVGFGCQSSCGEVGLRVPGTARCIPSIILQWPAIGASRVLVFLLLVL
jgi:hypothetical protein